MVEDKVRQIIIEQLGCNPDKVVPEATLESLGADSLDFIELIMVLEEELAIEIPDQDAEKLNTVGDIIDYYKKKLG